MSFYYTYKFNTERWINDNTRVVGCNAKTIDYQMRISQGLRDLGKIAVLNYFLCILCQSKDDEYLNSQLSNFRTMMYSASKQRKYFIKVLGQLRQYKVEEKYEKGFEHDIRGLEDRSNWLFLIVQENLRLTEYYPYFQKHGFDELLEFQNTYDADPSDDLYALFEKINEWNESHKKQVEAYSKKIKKEKEIIQKHRNEVYEKAQKEKEEAKQRKKEENEMIKEMKKNDKAYKSRQKQMEVSLFGRPGKGR